MNNTLEQTSIKEKLPDPIKATQPEPWQWDVLAKAFLKDPVLNFWLGEKTNEAVLQDFFEAVVRDTFSSGGAVYSSPDRKIVLIWTRHGYSLEESGEWKKRWYDILDPEGVKRYYWLYEMGNVEIDPVKRNKSMLPDYLAALPEVRGNGYAIHLTRWTIKYFEDIGYEVPFLLASTRRNATLYGRYLGFKAHKEVLLEGYDDAAVFMKRNK
jgi:GNAT superfamily N-acetyltransferase